MYRSRNRGSSRRGRGAKGSLTAKVPLKGLFSDGVWKCNCEPRLPAQHFQTKNGGKNHGRWFYTCQHPQPKRCDFFLWDDEAKGREAAAVLNNSRTEPGLSAAPITPNKSIISNGLATPQTESSHRGWGLEEIRTPYATKIPVKLAIDAKRETNDAETRVTEADDGSDEEFFDWPASDAEELGKVADGAVLGNPSSITLDEMLPPPRPPPETPRKAMKTNVLTTPGKRRYDEMDTPTGIGKGYLTPTTMGLNCGNDDDIFAAPRISMMKTADKTVLFPTKATTASGLVDDRPAETPTPIRYRDVLLGGTDDSQLASEVFATLAAHAVALPADTRDVVKGICNRHVLYTRGIIKGRDVSRAMVKAKSEKIVEMQAEIEALKSERETNRAVIRHLRRDMAQQRQEKKMI